MSGNDGNEENFGDNFQSKSKYFRGKIPPHYLDWQNKPKQFKTYENALSKIQLPKPDLKEDIEFWKVIIGRHSTRRFNDEPLSLVELSSLLFGMTGLTRVTQQSAFRTTPSAGGLFPIEIYVAINNVEDLKKGIYHYNILEHCLELLKEGDFREKVSQGCLGQRIAYTSSVNFIWTAMIERSKWKYRQRCYRYIYLDCGHIGQNFYLVAEALGLGACTIGAIFDDELNDLLEIDGIKETAIYVGVVGKK